MSWTASLKSAIYDREERKQHYQAHIRGLNAFHRHQKFLNDYAKFYGGKETSEGHKLPARTDHDALRDAYRFIPSEDDQINSSWEQRLVKRYYDKLFKEYCIADMSKYKTGKIGLRWRTEKEVISGKGQFICGNKHCDDKDGLASFEVNFSYFEAGEKKQALVKLVACERCAEKLHYRRNKEKEQSESKENDDLERKRKVLKMDEDMDDEHRKSAVRKRSKPDESGSREKEDSSRQRERPSTDCSSDEETEKSETKKRKGKRVGNEDNHEDEDNFDEFLEGMFP